MYILTKEEILDIESIESTYYMKPILKHFDEFVNKNNDEKSAWKIAFNKIYEVLKNSEKEVREILKDRLEKKEITDINQSLKSIAGNAFSNCIVYLFLKNKLVENICSDVYITSKKSRVKGFDDISTIYVGDETQKPDVDLIVYSYSNSQVLDKCIILSLKTSLRERAGQTYKWKLLMEIATTKNPIKDKYDIHYNISKIPLVCFATVNFYNEISNPQHKGMFKFFDKAFIAKEIHGSNFISPMSDFVTYVNQIFCKYS